MKYKLLKIASTQFPLWGLGGSNNYGKTKF
jgi:hypothetical protein